MNKNNNNSLFGAENFQRIIIGSKPKKKESVIQKIKRILSTLRQKFHRDDENKNDEDAS